MRMVEVEPPWKNLVSEMRKRRIFQGDEEDDEKPNYIFALCHVGKNDRIDVQIMVMVVDQALRLHMRG